MTHNVWKPSLYDTKMGFVSELGMGVTDLLEPGSGERILDLGCGTGDLTNVLAEKGAEVIGLDASSEMIERARAKYPGITFNVADGQSFRVAPAEFDAVFSNAALHWMKDAAGVAASVALALRPGGRFVAEFGGQGNVEHITAAVVDVLEKHGIAAAERNPWYFPSIGEYASLLEQHGFRVQFAFHFDRPTPLPDGEQGLEHWLRSFANPFFAGLSEEERAPLYAEIAEAVRPTLFRDGVWEADYKRIRIRAVKK